MATPGSVFCCSRVAWHSPQDLDQTLQPFIDWAMRAPIANHAGEDFKFLVQVVPIQKEGPSCPTTHNYASVGDPRGGLTFRKISEIERINWNLWKPEEESKLVKCLKHGFDGNPDAASYKILLFKL